MVGVEVVRGTLDGYGYGDGSGYGDGDGSGDGYGYGYGDGYGDGSGYGYGYGYGDGAYWRATMPVVVRNWSTEQRERFNALTGLGVPIAFWRSDVNGQPSNGGRANIPATQPGVIHTARGPLSLCKDGTLHATLIPPKWQGARIWIVALHGKIIGDDEKFGCLEREILGEYKFSNA